MDFKKTFKGISDKELQGFIKQAMQDIAKNGYDEKISSTTYDVVDAVGNKYPPLETIRRAAQLAERKLMGGMLKGGKATNQFYKQLGFKIIPKGAHTSNNNDNRNNHKDGQYPNNTMQQQEIPIYKIYIFNKYERDEIKPTERKAIEGELAERKFMARKRNKRIADERKRKDKYTCVACGFNYGRGIVECHHLEPIAMIGKSTVTLDDLITLCPTCHRLAHGLLKQDYKKYINKNYLITELQKIRMQAQNKV